jgi:hemerythrin-like domain-containing protein
MIQSHPTEILTNEHRVIERVLRALESEVMTLEKPPFPRDFFDRALEFFATFADGCHHAKEERWLFPVLEKRGLTRDGGPIGVMLYEHVQGRARLAEIRQNLDAAERGDRKAIEAVRRASESYIHLLRQHIWKEDNVLFHMARMVLSAQDIEELGKQFRAIGQQGDGQDDQDRFLHLAEELSGAAAARL